MRDAKVCLSSTEALRSLDEFFSLFRGIQGNIDCQIVTDGTGILDTLFNGAFLAIALIFISERGLYTFFVDLFTE